MVRSLHCTAQHSTAQHSTAQHSTAQHSTVQRGAAKHISAQQPPPAPAAALRSAAPAGDELRAARDAHPDTMRLDIALSLSETNRSGGQHYVQDLIEEEGGKFLELMAGPDALFYFW